MFRPLGLASSLLLLVTVPTRTGPPVVRSAEAPGILVTVGETTSDRAALWVRAEAAGPVPVRYGPVGVPAVRVAAARPRPEHDHTARLVLEGLAAATLHRYEVGEGPEQVSGEFVTAPEPGADVAARFLWSGDLGGSGHCRHPEDGYRIFGPMADRRPDLFLFVGDTIYADGSCGAGGGPAATLADFHRRYRYNRADPQVQRLLRRTSVYAIWDDHEVRNNFVGPAEPLMPVGRQAFLDYWPVLAPAEEPGRLYRRVRWGRHLEIFILDTRQYRSPNRWPDGPDKTMLGQAQRAWLLAGVVASRATWKVVVSSVPLGVYTGGGPADAWSNANLLGFPRRDGSGFARERDRLLEAFRRAGVRNLVFVGGEVHHGQLIRHQPHPGWVVHEFLAGPLAARRGFPRPLDRSLHPRSLGAVGLTANFGEVEVDGRALTVRIRDGTGGVRLALTLDADDGPPRPASP